MFQPRFLPHRPLYTASTRAPESCPDRPTCFTAMCIFRSKIISFVGLVSLATVLCRCSSCAGSGWKWIYAQPTPGASRHEVSIVRPCSAGRSFRALSACLGRTCADLPTDGAEASIPAASRPARSATHRAKDEECVGQVWQIAGLETCSLKQRKGATVIGLRPSSEGTPPDDRSPSKKSRSEQCHRPS